MGKSAPLTAAPAPRIREQRAQSPSPHATMYRDGHHDLGHDEGRLVHHELVHHRRCVRRDQVVEKCATQSGFVTFTVPGNASGSQRMRQGKRPTPRQATRRAGRAAGSGVHPDVAGPVPPRAFPVSEAKGQRPAGVDDFLDAALFTVVRGDLSYRVFGTGALEDGWLVPATGPGLERQGHPNMDHQPHQHRRRRRSGHHVLGGGPSMARRQLRRTHSKEQDTAGAML